jgi:hypothetical protein
LDLNVLFDTESRLETRDIKIELKDVTAAKALDYVFLQENLFFQKVGPRTILVANGNRRQNFQQLVLRTFYLANSNPKDVAKVVQTGTGNGARDVGDPGPRERLSDAEHGGEHGPDDTPWQSAPGAA